MQLLTTKLPLFINLLMTTVIIVETVEKNTLDIPVILITF